MISLQFGHLNMTAIVLSIHYISLDLSAVI